MDEVDEIRYFFLQNRSIAGTGAIVYAPAKKKKKKKTNSL